MQALAASITSLSTQPALTDPINASPSDWTASTEPTPRGDGRDASTTVAMANGTPSDTQCFNCGQISCMKNYTFGIQID
jgi:hypothetical protein